MKKILVLLFCITLPVFSQEIVISKKFIMEYSNNKTPGSFFRAEQIGPDDTRGNGIGFDQNGYLLVFQYDQGYFYRFNKDLSTLLEKKYLGNDYGGKIRVYDDLIITEGYGHLIGYGSDFTPKWRVIPVNYGTNFPSILSFFYHADILFFTDSNNKLHCVLNPSLDQIENRKNYRNPEQTKALFSQDSKIDLLGLSINESGRLFINNAPVSFTGPVVGKIRYSIDWTGIAIWRYDDSIINSFDVYHEAKTQGEILESIAVHPSGDIYFLCFNGSKKKHLLYKIENTWDPEAKQAWEKEHKN